MAYVIGNVQSGIGTTSPVSISLDVNEDDVAMFVGASDVGAPTFSGVTVGGNAASLVTGAAGSAEGAGKDIAGEMWFLEGSPQGTQSVEVSYSGGNGIIIIAVAIGGLDAAPASGGTSISATDGTTPSLDVSSASGDVVFGAAVCNGLGNAITPGAGETELDDQTNNFGNGHIVTLAGLYEDGASTVTLSPTPVETVDKWIIVGASFAVASGGGGGITLPLLHAIQD